MLSSLSLICGVLAGLSAVRGQSVIVPGAHWTDTSGNSIQAHGAGIIKVCTISAYECVPIKDSGVCLGWKHLLLARRGQVAQQRLV